MRDPSNHTFQPSLDTLKEQDQLSTDAELFQRFALQGDQAAFALLIKRYGPMVQRVARGILRDVNAVDDVFQATFLVLAQRAGSLRRSEAVGPFLHATAYRIAMDSVRAAQRRSRHERAAAHVEQHTGPEADISLREARSVVDGELAELADQYRVPLILCYLEGKTTKEAARELGLSDRTIDRRLQRGREMLGKRLAQRGIELTGLLFPVLLLGKADAAVPAALVASTARTAALVVQGVTSASPVALLAQNGASSLGIGSWLAATAKLLAAKSLASVLVLGAALAGSVWLASSWERPKPNENAGRPADAELFPHDPLTAGLPRDAAVRGRVLDQEGRPVPHARVALLVGRSVRGEFGRRDDVLRLGEADDEGRFTLDLPNDPPVWRPGRREVKVLASAAGHALAAAAVALKPDMQPAEVRLPTPGTVRGQVVDAAHQPVADVAVHVVRVGPVSREPVQGWSPPETATLPWPGPAVTDDRGRFELGGLDLRQGLGLEVHDGRYARQRAFLDVSPMLDVSPTRQRGNPSLARRANVLPGTAGEADVTIRLAPAQLVEGQVVAADTGQPLPYARVSLVPCQPLLAFPGLMEHVDARADIHGRFSVRPLPGSAFKIFACAPESEPYLMMEQTVPWPAGTVRQELQLSLPRGIALRGQIVDADTGNPVPDVQIEYFAHLTTADVPSGDDVPKLAGASREWSGPDGRFFAAVHPGRGFLKVYAFSGGYLVRPPETLPMLDRELYKYNYAHALVPLDLPVNCREHEVRVELHRAGKLQGRVLGVDGSPVSSGVLLTAGYFAHYSGTGARCFGVRNGTFAVSEAHPHRTYPVIVLDATRRYGCWATLAGAARGPGPTLHLEPCGQAQGRLVNRDGVPLPDLQIDLCAELPIASTGRLDDAVLVSWYTALGREESRRTDVAGRFVLPVLVPGLRYRLHAIAGASRQLVNEFTVAAGETRSLPDGVIRLGR